MKKLIDFKSLTSEIQAYADLHFEGNFSLAVRALIREGFRQMSAEDKFNKIVEEFKIKTEQFARDAIDLNEGILLVMKWISDNKSVSNHELNLKQVDAYLTYDDAMTKDAKSSDAKSSDAYAAYAEHEAIYAAHTGNEILADTWVDNYFDRTGESKLDYIDALDKQG
tara:strand:- start:48 stop:548 length:501 start_codon:yes stop_codon:yes gene_type:complete